MIPRGCGAYKYRLSALHTRRRDRHRTTLYAQGTIPRWPTRYGAGISEDAVTRLLADQVTYYRARAPEYLDDTLELPDACAIAEELERALDHFAPIGDVLELACGPGVWTAQLLRHATSVTAVDAAPEMLSIARERVGDTRVTFLCADLFAWQPERRYAVVFFGFWLSHVPLERFAAFWSLVDECLASGGRVFFVDDAYRTPLSSSPARPRRPSSGGCVTAPRTGWSRCLTRLVNSRTASPALDGTSPSRPPRLGRSSGALATAPPPASRTKGESGGGRRTVATDGACSA